MHEAMDGSTGDAVPTGPDAAPGALAAYGLHGLRYTEPRHLRAGHARRPGRRALGTAAVAVLVLVSASATALLWAGSDEDVQAAPTAPPPPEPGLELQSLSSSQALLPGRSVTGSVRVVNRQARPVRVREVTFTATASDACANPGVSVAPNLPPTPEAPLEVPALGIASLPWTAYMDGESEQACQGATVTSAVLLDGVPAGEVTLTAGTLEPPPAPVGGLTTSSRAAVRWSPSTVSHPGWVLERAVAGTDDWQPACGTSAARPLRTPACTDTGLTSSTSYAYRLTLRSGHWHTTSRPSAPVTTQERPSA